MITERATLTFKMRAALQIIQKDLFSGTTIFQKSGSIEMFQTGLLKIPGFLKFKIWCSQWFTHFLLCCSKWPIDLVSQCPVLSTINIAAKAVRVFWEQYLRVLSLGWY